ncbi:hypothetical protein GUJ93_ZPchr0002g26672 [Zizania palustris]|uniref:Clp R domain-containing protein n=1 Tax=Zizania palustris TaxID=103762 RepID=A0A8J5SA98_ZIZPA|nr:hypothetical protein GUJ93_ZPchr0002g26672 [Zizania palustris]
MRAYSATAAATSLPSAAPPPLTPDAAAVLSRAAAVASRRRHAHTTPLHAAAALLSGPAPLLRDACVAGLASPHPLRCRALDLCFAVALDRLPTSTEHQLHHDGRTFHAPPPLSNALAAALKRAYAHHRRIGGGGGGEADDHRVGVPHLVLAILDDPSVARVMREASFSSTAVKAAMLQSLPDPTAPDSGVYVNTRVLRRQASHRMEEVNKVVEVLKRDKKRNPVLVGDTGDVDAVVQEVVTMIQRQRLGTARVISFAREFGDLVDLDRVELITKIKELGEALRSELLATASKSTGVVVNLGNLQWLVEERRSVPPGEQEKRRNVVLDTARAAVAKMARILRQAGDCEHRIWVIGTATCATYLKCQVYHPALESEWDLQAVPIKPRPPPPPPSLGLSLSPSANGVNRGILSSSVEVLSSAMTSAMQRAPSLCDADGDERERAENMTSPDTVALHPNEQPMSLWLQIGTPSAARAPIDRTQDKAREADELRLRWWLDRCAQLHSHGDGLLPPMVTCSEWNGANVLGSMQALSAVPLGAPAAAGGAVDTDLALGRPACDPNEDMLVKRLTEAVRWQPEAAAAVGRTIAKAMSGEGKRRGMGPMADTWVVFAGHDVAGKMKMAEALSMSVFGTGAVTVRLGFPTTGDFDGGESIVSCRACTALDRMANAIRANPFRVIVLDGFDQDDRVVHASIVRSIESGQLVDSHGRDVALGSAILVVMLPWSSSPDDMRICQEEVPFADSPWNLKLGVRQKTPKRRPEQALDGGDHRRTKPRKDSAREPLHLDLNLSMCEDHRDDDDDDISSGEESRNSSSDLTVEHEHGQPATAPSSVSELIKVVDATVMFKPINFGTLKRSISDHVVPAKLGDAAGGRWWSLNTDDGLLDRLAGAAWTAGASATSLQAWADEVLCPTLRQLKRSLSANDADGATVSLSAVDGIGRTKHGEVFPTSVTVAVDGN